MKRIFYLLLLAFSLTHCRPKEEKITTQFSGKPEVPSSIIKEHEYLLDKMKQFTLLADSAGLAAVQLDELMQHHFNEEEDYVLPPLGLLTLLANGTIPAQSAEVILLTEKLKSQRDHISAEHQMIDALMEELMQAAPKENQPAILEFEKEVHKHATIEEEVLFPAAILVGEYLKMKVHSR